MRTVLAAMGALVVGVVSTLAALHPADDLEQVPSTEAIAPQRERPHHGATRDPGPWLEAIGQVVRSELAAAERIRQQLERVACAVDEGPAEADALARAPERWSESEDAAAARAIVDRSLAAGEWSSADRDQLHELFGGLGKKEHMELLRELILAANQGRIQVTTEGPLF